MKKAANHNEKRTLNNKSHGWELMPAPKEKHNPCKCDETLTGKQEGWRAPVCACLRSRASAPRQRRYYPNQLLVITDFACELFLWFAVGCDRLLCCHASESTISHTFAHNALIVFYAQDHFHHTCFDYTPPPGCAVFASNIGLPFRLPTSFSVFLGVCFCSPKPSCRL